MSQEQKDRAPRFPVSTRIRFTVLGSHVVTGKTVNLSESGIRFTSHEPMKIIMSYDLQGKTIEKKGHLVWARPEGEDYTYGFEFIEEKEPLPED